MPVDTIRDQLRLRRATVQKKGQALGVKIEDVRREKRGARTVTGQIATFIGDNPPLPGRERLVLDNPVNGAFDGVNLTFTITEPCAGPALLLVGVVTQSTGTVNFPTRTDHPAPSAGNFYFDGDQTIIIGAGDILSAQDRVFAVYIRKEAVL